MSLKQQPFADAGFAENAERRCPVVLLLDTSYSMQGDPIRELNEGLELFRDELLGDPVAAKRVEVAIVTFGPVQEVSGFTGAESFVAPRLEVSGDTPVGAAIACGLDLLADRKQQYRDNGISYYRPWVLLITDGGPTDEWRHAASRVRQGEADKAFSFFAIGVEGADMATLAQISAPTRSPLELKGLMFRELFRWLSASMKAVSSSKPGAEVQLANPAAPNGWASV